MVSDLAAPGRKAPFMAVGDGALDFRGALRALNEFRTTREQRCWFHKMSNVLNALPARLQAQARKQLREMMTSSTLSDAIAARKRSQNDYHAKCPKSGEKVVKDWAELTASHSMPALHWQHLRTTNAIESSFATVRLRTNVKKGVGSLVSVRTMALKLLQDAELIWSRIGGFDEIENVMNGLICVKGGVVATTTLAYRHRPEVPAA